MVFFLVGGCKNSVEKPSVPSSGDKALEVSVAPPVDQGKPASEPGAGESSAGTEEPTPPPTIPTVSLDAANEATCLVKVGDVFPEGTLSDAAGKPVELKSLLGKNLAVVYFWTNKDLYAVAGLEELGTLVPKEFDDAKAVRVIAVNEGDSPEAVRPLLEKTAARVTNLFDPDGAVFKKIATERLPRIYLVDSDGKIVWFDLEYSRSMKRNLQQALEVALSTELAPKQGAR